MPHSDYQKRREYHLAWRKENRDKLREKDRAWRELNKERCNSLAARSHRMAMRKRRRELIEFLGGSCIDCGLTDERTFNFHHVNGDGKNHRTSGYTSSYYIKLMNVEREKPGSIALLCANCHAIKHWRPDDYIGEDFERKQTPISERKYKSVINSDVAREIKRLSELGKNAPSISRELEVSVHIVRKVVSGRSWTWVE